LYPHSTGFLFLGREKVTFSEENIPQSVKVLEALQSKFFRFPTSSCNKNQNPSTIVRRHGKYQGFIRTRNHMERLWGLGDLEPLFSLELLSIFGLLFPEECI
jgi:hypothetical protein